MKAVYGPIEGEVEERERFWNDSDRVVHRISNWFRLCVLADLKVGITGGLEVPGENDNGRRVNGFCSEIHTSRTRICINAPGEVEANMERR